MVTDPNDPSPPDILQRRQNTRRLLGDRELERSAMVLFALFTASKSGIQNLNQADLVNSHAMLDKLSGILRNDSETANSVGTCREGYRVGMTPRSKDPLSE